MLTAGFKCTTLLDVFDVVRECNVIGFSGQFLRFYASIFEKVGRKCFCLYVRPYLRPFVQAMVFLLNIWIPLN